MILTCKDLKNSNLFHKAWSLYEKAFPEIERRNLKEQKKILEDNRYKALAYLDGNTFIGIVFYWDFNNFRFIEHFAIDSTLRGKSYGSKILESLINSHENIVLEIELIHDAISKKRLRFYEKFDFKVNDFKHYQVPFREGQESLELLFLSHGRVLSKNEYEELNSEMKNALRV